MASASALAPVNSRIGISSKINQFNTSIIVYTSIAVDDELAITCIYVWSILEMQHLLSLVIFSFFYRLLRFISTYTYILLLLPLPLPFPLPLLG